MRNEPNSIKSFHVFHHIAKDPKYVHISPEDKWPLSRVIFLFKSLFLKHFCLKIGHAGYSTRRYSAWNMEKFIENSSCLSLWVCFMCSNLRLLSRFHEPIQQLGRDSLIHGIQLQWVHLGSICPFSAFLICKKNKQA